MEENYIPYRLEEVLPIRFGFLKALPIYLWLIGLVIFHSWVFYYSSDPMKATASNILVFGLLGTLISSFFAYIFVYGFIFGFVISSIFIDVGHDFGGDYTSCNIWGYNVWVYQPKDKEMQIVVLSRGVSITDFLCRYFSGQAANGYVLRYSTGGWFRGGADFWFIDNHVPRPRSVSVRRVGRANDNHIYQELRVCDMEGSVIYWRVCDLFEHASVRGTAGIDFASELNWLRNRYVENDTKRLKAV